MTCRIASSEGVLGLKGERIVQINWNLTRAIFLCVALLALPLRSELAAQETTTDEATVLDCDKQEEPCNKIRIGVFYLNTPTGQRHRDGILKAISEHPFGDEVCVRQCAYVNESKGVEALLKAIVPTKKKDKST